MDKMTADQRAIAKRAYPEYKGRKFRVSTRSVYFMQDYWSEGSRNYVVAVNLETGEIGHPTQMVHNPFNGSAHAKLTIPAGFALIEHSIFCGKDCGLTFITAESLQLTGPPVAALCGNPALASEVR